MATLILLLTDLPNKDDCWHIRYDFWQVLFEATFTAQTGSHAGLEDCQHLLTVCTICWTRRDMDYTATNGNLYHQNSNSSHHGDTYTAGDVIGSAFDADNGTLEFYKNGISQGLAATD